MEPIFADVEALLLYCSQKKFGWQKVQQTIAKHYGVRDSTAQHIWYLLQRSRGTEEHIARLVRADKIKEFDWNCVLRGEEDTELKRFNL